MLQPQEKIYPPQILLMEDEPNVAKGLELVLSDEGYQGGFGFDRPERPGNIQTQGG